MGGGDQYTDGAYSLGGEHIHKENGRLELKEIKFVPMSYFNKANKGIIQNNDILICKDGALTGKIAIIRDELNDVPAMVNEHVFILRTTNLITQKYAFHVLHSEMGQNLLKANITGAAQGGLNSTNLKNIKIPLPHLDIQTKIVTECEKIDDEFNRTRMQIEEYRAKISKIFNELEIARGRFKINELQLLLKRGKSPKYGNSSIQVIKSGQARGYNEFLFNERFFLADNFIIDERKLQKGDILINSTGEGTAGRVTLFGLDGDFVVDSHITIFRPNEKVLPKFAMYSLAHIGFKTIERMATGASGQIELNLSTIGNISFLVPDLNEQQSIVNQINEIETQISELEKVLENSRQEKKAVLDKWL